MSKPTRMIPPSPEPPSVKAPEVDPLPAAPAQLDESGGPTGLEPTRYGDWERNGRCVDF